MAGVYSSNLFIGQTLIAHFKDGYKKEARKRRTAHDRCVGTRAIGAGPAGRSDDHSEGYPSLAAIHRINDA